ncbi:hypothetical protein [Streptomyces violarus]|uniref:hypothetical protein n=1 Tax=Streptomyces violarus TaxID=67380 RepID=UPI0021BF9CCC|nr:hypothetical protein [Streptomyces violarus]MCT9144986.1 hypothetical protein [Streptomyces violarus]
MANVPEEKVVGNQEFEVPLCAVSTYWNGGSGKAGFTAYVDLDATRPIQLLHVDCGSGS